MSLCTAYTVARPENKCTVSEISFYGSFNNSSDQYGTNVSSLDEHLMLLEQMLSFNIVYNKNIKKYGINNKI